MAAVIVLRDCTPPEPNERLRQWREKYDRVPLEDRTGTVHRFDFRPVREPVDPDAYAYRSA